MAARTFSYMVDLLAHVMGHDSRTSFSNLVMHKAADQTAVSNDLKRETLDRKCTYG